MIRFIFSLAVLSSLAYGGLYFYYDINLTSAVDGNRPLNTSSAEGLSRPH